MVEKEKVGGTCLHRGCIPAKALLHAAEVFRTVGHAAEHGVSCRRCGPASRTGPAPTSARPASSTSCTRASPGLLKRRKVTVVDGLGTLTADGAVSVDGQTLTRQGRDHLLRFGATRHPGHGRSTASGSSPPTTRPTATPRQLPERVAVIGGGVIGAEFASVYTDLGVHTTLLEALPHGVLPIGPDRDVANVLAKSLAKRGTEIHAEARVGTLEAHRATGSLVPFETPKGSEKIEVDQVLVSIGRRPVTEDIGAGRGRGHVSTTAASSRSTPPRC